MWYVWGKREIHTRFWWGNVEERDHLEDIYIDGRRVIKSLFVGGHGLD